MQSLEEILLLEDLINKYNSRCLEIRNLEFHKDKIRKFAGIINRKFSLPIIEVPFSGKIMYVSFILRQNRLSLSLNVVYDKVGKIKCCESLSQSRELEKIHATDSIRTLDGKKFRREIDISELKNVKVVDISALIPKGEDMKIIESANEKFANKDKILAKFNSLQSQKNSV